MAFSWRADGGPKVYAGLVVGFHGISVCVDYFIVFAEEVREGPNIFFLKGSG